MITDLQSLIDPLTEGQFLTLLRERKLTFLPGSNSRRFESLLNWEALNHLLDGTIYPLQHLRVLRESNLFPGFSTSSKIASLLERSPTSLNRALV